MAAPRGAAVPQGDTTPGERESSARVCERSRQWNCASDRRSSSGSASVHGAANGIRSGSWDAGDRGVREPREVVIGRRPQHEPRRLDAETEERPDLLGAHLSTLGSPERAEENVTGGQRFGQAPEVVKSGSRFSRM